MNPNHTLLDRLCRAAGYDIDIDQHAIATAHDTTEVMAFLDAAYILAAAQLRAEWAREAAAATHDLLRDMPVGEISDEARMLHETITALAATERFIEHRTAIFAEACDTLHQCGGVTLIYKPITPAPDSAVSP